MRKSILVGAIAAVLALPAVAQDKFEVKVAEFVGAQHFMTKWLVGWGEKLEKASNGRLVFKHFPGAQMAPPPAHYDLARTGQADVSWFLHGGTPGRFPLTELISLPYMAGSAEIGTKVLNDQQLRSRYLDAEHRGVKVLLLLTHQPGNVHTTKKPIRSADDMKGLRIRFAAPTIRDFVSALGGTAVGVQPGEQLEMLEARGLEVLNRAIAEGGIHRVDGSAQGERVKEALVTRDRKLAYRIEDGIPVLLAEEAIALGQIPDFPAA